MISKNKYFQKNVQLFVVEANKKRILSLILRVAVVGFVIAIGFYFLARSGQDWSRFNAILKTLKPAVLCYALILFLLSQALIGLRWYMLLRLQQIDIGLWSAIKLTFVGGFYNNILPSSMGGDAIRAWYVTKHTTKRLEAVFSVLVDRAVGLAGLVLMAMAAYFMTSAQSGIRKLNFRYHSGIFAFIKNHHAEILISLFVLFAIAVGIVSIGPIRRKIMALSSKALNWSTSIYNRTFDAFALYCKKPLSMIGVLGLTFICQAVFILGCYLLGRNLGIEISFLYYLVFFPIGWVLGALPVSIGGAVIVEGGLVFLFVKVAGVSVEAALALALCQRAIILVGSLPGAFVHMVGAHAPKEFSIDYELSTK